MKQMEKVFFDGTHRVRSPELTLELITPLLGEFGITRLADVTGLDVLGVPVVMAVRPLASTLSVAQGKGATLLLAKVSAAMESIEFWHAENAVPPPSVLARPATGLSLGYQFQDLSPDRSTLMTPHTALDWVAGRTVPSGRPALVPRGLVQLGRYSRDDWLMCMPNATTNGLASGNTRAEAIVHALYEVIERDAVSELARVPAGQRAYIEPASVRDACCAASIAAIQEAEAWMEIVSAPNRFGLPCFVTYLWREDMPAAMAVGSGAHSDPAVALSRAITEAAQSRLTAIVGTRDDLPARAYAQPHADIARPVSPAGRAGWEASIADFSPSFRTDDDEAAWAGGQIAALTGYEPIVVDLGTRPELAVVKVLCPGTAFRARHDIPRSAPVPA
jgi:ribosomal protein S12 methylthiotransferase accessory factor